MKYRIKKTIVADYGLYSIILEERDNKSNLFLEIGGFWASLNFRININKFWHDLSKWKEIPI